MRTEAQLEIVWDGSVRGLSEHRVSLAAFGPAMTQLLAATRRIASQLIQNAHEASDKGRLVKAATHIDIELARVKEGSSGFESVLTFDAPGGQAVMFDRFVEDVGTELMDCIEYEARGVYKNAAVRRYLAYLPEGLTKQTYRLQKDGREIRSFEIGEMKLPEEVSSQPLVLLQALGSVIGIGFEPGRPEVRVKGDGVTVTATANDKQIEKAIHFRGSEVFALAVASPEGTRLISLKTAEEREERRNKATEAIFEKWRGAFEALA